MFLKHIISDTSHYGVYAGMKNIPTLYLEKVTQKKKHAVDEYT